MNRDGKRFDEVGREAGVGADPEERDERRVRRRLQRRPPVDLQDEHLRAGRAGAGQRPLGAEETGNRLRRRSKISPSSLGVDLGGWSWGAQFGDLNNDGTLDLYLVNGYVSAGERTSYWYDFAQIAVGHSAIISDAQNWPAMNGRSLSGYQRKRVWINDGLGRFTDVAQVVGVTDVYDGRAVALADLGNRGVLDVIVANQRGPLLDLPQHGAAGTPLDRFRAGRRRAATAARSARASNCTGTTSVQVQEVSGGSGFSAQNQRRLHFGLGERGQIDRVVIRWPSGTVQTIEQPPVDTLQRIKEPA